MTGKNFWKDKPVFVTGATGFVGSSLAARLVSLGARVIALVRDEVSLSNFYRLQLDQSVTVVRGNLEDHSLLERAVNEYAIEAVYHLGAQAIVGAANRSPLSTFRANIEGTWNLLDACRGKDNLRAIVVASSDKAYGTHSDLPYREDYSLNPEYPYDVSKACADLIARSYVNTFHLPIAITRFANIYGPGDINDSRIVPETIRAALDGRAPVIRSDGTPERDYIYIDDVIDLYLLLGERIEEARGEVFNAGHNKPIRVLDLVEKILQIAGRGDLRPLILGKGKPAGEIDRQWLDGSKVKARLGWSPRVKLEDGLSRTIDWVRSLNAN